MNGVVTIANGGYMPVVGEHGSPLSVWIPATHSSLLLPLADHAIWRRCQVKLISRWANQPLACETKGDA